MKLFQKLLKLMSKKNKNGNKLKIKFELLIDYDAFEDENQGKLKVIEYSALKNHRNICEKAIEKAMKYYKTEHECWEMLWKNRM